MSEELIGIGRLRLHEGKLEEFKRLSAHVMEIVRTMDTGTLQFEIYFNDDQSECILIERYKDSAGFNGACRARWRHYGADLCNGDAVQRNAWRTERRAQSNDDGQ